VYALVGSDADYQGGQSADLEVTFTAAPQTIGLAASRTSTSYKQGSHLSAWGYSGTGTISYELDMGSYGHTSSWACRLSGSTLSSLLPTDCWVYATIGADANYQSAQSADVEITFTPASVTPVLAAQSISVSASPTSAGWTATSDLLASGYLGTGTVSYALDTGSFGETSSSGCRLSGTTLSASGPGACWVYAAIGADADYQSAQSADIKVTFTAVAPSAPVITDLPALASYGGEFTPTVSTDSDGKTSVGSSTPSVCTVSGAMVRFVGVGTCTLTGAVEASTDYLEATGTSTSFDVSKSATTLTSAIGTVKRGAHGWHLALSAELVSDTTGKAISGQLITFRLGGHSCEAKTNADGVASCTISGLPAYPGSDEYRAIYGGSRDYSAISDASNGTRSLRPRTSAAPSRRARGLKV
jgi:hypothetical protein